MNILNGFYAQKAEIYYTYFCHNFFIFNALIVYASNKASDKKKVLKAVDFFCCAGGVTHGFRKAGIKVLGGIDKEGVYKNTYEKNNKGSIFIEADIAELQPEDLKKKLSISQNMDDLIFVGCSPCQYYTNLHTDKTKSSKSKLLLDEFKKLVDYFRPGYIFIENVPGLETKRRKPAFKV